MLILDSSLFKLAVEDQLTVEGDAHIENNGDQDVNYYGDVFLEGGVVHILCLDCEVHLIEHAANVALERVLVDPRNGTHRELPESDARSAEAVAGDLRRVDHHANECDQLDRLSTLVAFSENVVDEVEVCEPWTLVLVLLNFIDDPGLHFVASKRKANIERDHTRCISNTQRDPEAIPKRFRDRAIKVSNVQEFWTDGDTQRLRYHKDNPNVDGGLVWMFVDPVYH